VKDRPNQMRPSSPYNLKRLLVSASVPAFCFFAATDASATTFPGQRTGTDLAIQSGAGGNVGKLSQGMTNMVVDQGGTCRYLDFIGTGQPLAIFYNTTAEWNAFLANLPAGSVRSDQCCIAQQTTFTACSTADNPQTTTITVDRARAGDTGTISNSFNCAKQLCWPGDQYNAAGCSNVTWTETASRAVTCTSSGNTNGSMAVNTQTIVGSMPANCPPQVTGQTWWAADGSGSRGANGSECSYGGTVSWTNLRQWSCSNGTVSDTGARQQTNYSTACSPPPPPPPPPPPACDDGCWDQWMLINYCARGLRTPRSCNAAPSGSPPTIIFNFPSDIYGAGMSYSLVATGADCGSYYCKGTQTFQGNCFWTQPGGIQAGQNAGIWMYQNGSDFVYDWTRSSSFSNTDPGIWGEPTSDISPWSGCHQSFWLKLCNQYGCAEGSAAWTVH
jgi:hypothetical protein